MYEVEVKVPADLTRVRDRLDALGADSLGTVEQVDTYYDHPVRSFAETDEALRLRRTGDDGYLTYKGPKVDDASKTRREVEVAVDATDAADGLLRAVGFEPAAEVRKTRERYAHDGYTVSLDDVDGLGEFVEVEAAGEEAAIDALREGAYDVLDRLDLDPADQVRASYLALLDAQK
ncbi:MAG: class IV adenylate cyclase [Halobacteriales archaeon]